MEITLKLGDCIEVLKTIPDNSIDSIVTDPPYGLSFMGKKWDYDVPSVDIWIECLRVLKPGGHLLSFAGSRTYHRMGVAIEDAGFEIRDQIMWVYGSGFPKSHNIGKAIDKLEIEHNYEGWGTALKPAHEPIVMARKPLSEKSIVENVLKHGTGGINIDESRIEIKDKENINFDRPRVRKDQKEYFGNHLPDGYFKNEDFKEYNEAGRWPANIIFDEEAGKLLDEQSGISKGNKPSKRNKEHRYSQDWGHRVHDGMPIIGYDDKGGASRFFYCPKAAKKDRNEGLDNFTPKTDRQKGHGLDRICGHCGTSMLKPEDCKCEEPDWITPPKLNHHPTVKPTDLMRYLINLVTPKGGTTLDPFIGSGSTGKAAVQCGVNFIGIEKEEEYMKIAEARINHEKNKPTQQELF